jgi:dolichol-phosphate mannosyltransferase
MSVNKCFLAGEEMEKDGRPPSVLVLIAALNEEKGIAPTLTELREVLGNPNFVVVDGSSTDKTVEIAKDMGANVLCQEGSGKGDAIALAIRQIDSNVKYVIFTDADFTYPAGYLPEMLRILEENPEVGMVTGSRFNHHFELRSMRHPFYIGNRCLAWAQLLLNGVNLRDPLTGLRIIRWEILENWAPKSKGFDIEAEMNHRVERTGYKTVEIPIHYRERLGKKKLQLRHGFTIFKRIISESI